MKFISSFQCLMGGNGVPPIRFQDGSSSITPTMTTGSSFVNDVTSDKRSGSNNVVKKKKKKKSRKVIKVFQPDGEIKIYHKSIRVSEIMTEDYLVSRSDSFYIGQKIPSLSQHDRLQLGHVYFLLPTHLFHSVLSFVTIASFAAGSQQQNKAISINEDDNNMKMKAAFLKKAATSSCPPFDIQKTPSGSLRIRVSDQFISQLMTDQAAAAAAAAAVASGESNGKEFIDADLLCTTPLLHREYKQLVVESRRGWKPKLEMIKETPPLKGKRKVKLLLSASINRMKRKTNNKDNNVVSTSASNLSRSQPHQQKKNTKKKKMKMTTMTTTTSKPVIVSPSPPPPPPTMTDSISMESNNSSKRKIKGFSRNKTR